MATLVSLTDVRPKHICKELQGKIMLLAIALLLMGELT
jgi:hypothetical protein